MSPAKIPPRPMRQNAKSHDDLSAVSAMDAAEARLRAAMALADEEAKRADEEEQKNIDLQNELKTMRASLVNIQPPFPAPPKNPGDGKPISVSPQAVTIRGKHWKFTVPLTLLASLFPLIWTLASDYMQMKRDFKAQTETFGAITKRVEEVNSYAHEIARSNDELREKTAELSGYLAGILPKVGLKVSAEPGAAYINVVSDPLSPGQLKKRQKPIVVHTPVPAPAPK